MNVVAVKTAADGVLIRCRSILHRRLFKECQACVLDSRTNGYVIRERRCTFSVIVCVDNLLPHELRRQTIPVLPLPNMIARSVKLQVVERTGPDLVESKLHLGVRRGLLRIIRQSRNRLIAVCRNKLLAIGAIFFAIGLPAIGLDDNDVPILSSQAIIEVARVTIMRRIRKSAALGVNVLIIFARNVLNIPRNRMSRLMQIRNQGFCHACRFRNLVELRHGILAETVADEQHLKPVGHRHFDGSFALRQLPDKSSLGRFITRNIKRIGAILKRITRNFGHVLRKADARKRRASRKCLAADFGYRCACGNARHSRQIRERIIAKRLNAAFNSHRSDAHRKRRPRSSAFCGVVSHCA